MGLGGNLGLTRFHREANVDLVEIIPDSEYQLTSDSEDGPLEFIYTDSADGVPEPIFIDLNDR